MRRERLTPFAAGLLAVVLIALLIFLAFTRVNPFSNPYELKASFRDARNLGGNAVVRMAGVDVGKVTKVEPADGTGAATVTMELDDDALPLRQDVELEVRPRILLEGNYFVDIEPGSPSAPELDQGETVPVTQTSTAVSLPVILSTLRADVRTDLRTLLHEYGSVALQKGGAEAFNDAIPWFAPAYRNAAITNQALLGVQPRRDIPRLLRGQSRTAAALAEDPQALQDLVTDLNTVAGALAGQDTALAESVPALRDTLRAGVPGAARVRHRGAARRALDAGHARRGDSVAPAGPRSRSGGRAGRPRGRSAPGRASPGEPQRRADAAAQAAARALLVHQRRAHPIRRVADPEPRGG
jgi:phospholipid/cholesterol/gamma-HCH transport system substrate-binding protein